MEFSRGLFALIPTLRWGRGSVNEIGQETARWGHRAFIVVSASVHRDGLTEQVLHHLLEHDVVGDFIAVSGEPTLELLNDALHRARAFEAEVVIGLGGGSAMDLAKAVAGLFTHMGDIAEAFYGKTPLNKGLPLITLPTVFGSGAEVTPNAVFTDSQNKLKQSLRHSEWVARSVVVDPDLSVGVPLERLMFSGLDGLCQAIEAYTSIGANAVSDIFARDAALRFATDLPKALEHSEKIEARESLAIASFQGGIALASARLGAVHGLAHPLGARYDVPHGKVCATLLPMIMRFNLPEVFPKYAVLARDLCLQEKGMDTYDLAVQYVRFIMNLYKQWGVPQRLRQLGATKEDFDGIIAEALPSGSLKANPRKVQAADLMALLQENW